MPFSTPIVPMPRWSTPVGCTKLFLTIVVLAFVTACAIVWGSYPAFSISLFTASLSLVTFGYYICALSFEPSFYNKWLILSLETALTLLWFASLILLASWTGASTGITQHYYDIRPYPRAYGTAIDCPHGEVYRKDAMTSSSPSLFLAKRGVLAIPRTRVRYHSADAHYAAQILAGIAAGLAGMIFILYSTTTATFAMNFYMTTPETEVSAPRPATGEEAQSESSTASQAHNQPPPGSHPSPLRSNMMPMTGSPTATNVAVSPITMVPSITEPPMITTLPKDFEPHPQRHKSFSNIEEADQANIERPAPVIKAKAAENKMDTPANGDFVNSVVLKTEEMGNNTTVKGDGRVERET